MTHKLQTQGRQLLAMLTLVLLTAFTLSSCTKKKDDSNDGAKFVGTWAGTSSCSGSGNLVLSAGSDGKTVTMAGTVGDAACQKSITYNLTASGNNLSGNQTFTDLCGNSYTFVASGSLSGNTITMNFNISGAITANCTFTGTK